MEVGELNFRNVLLLAKNHKFYNQEIFNFKNTRNYDPFPMLFVASKIREEKNRNPVQHFIQIKNNSFSTYAGHMGFYKSISDRINYGKFPGEAKGSKTYIPITLINYKEDFRDSYNIEKEIEKKSFELAKVLTQQKNTDVVAYIIREMFRNSFEHSKSDNVWICAQYWPSYNYAEIAILDEGIGIKNSLTSNSNYRKIIKNDLDAIKLSLNPGITEMYKRKQYDDEWNNSGYGLYVAKEICIKSGGNFLICSGNSAFYCSDDTEEIFETDFSGTAIRMTISGINQDKNYKKIIDSIIKEGEEKSKQIKNAVNKASQSSKLK